jgi:hypothetical protein
MTGSKAIYVKNNPIIVQPSSGSQISDEDKYKGLTPKERLAKKKEEEAQRKMEEYTNAARNAKLNYQRAQEMKYNQFHASNKGGM